jgi:hypothetical protein
LAAAEKALAYAPATGDPWALHFGLGNRVSSVARAKRKATSSAGARRLGTSSGLAIIGGGPRVARSVAVGL